MFVALSLALGAAGCASTQRPQLKVLGVEQSEQAYDGRQIKLFVEVTNYAAEPMRLQRLQYVFSPSGSRDTAVRGEVSLSRVVEAGSAVVVEVPILVDPDLLGVGHLELRGQLIAELDRILHAYPVTAEVGAEGSDGGETATTTTPVEVAPAP